MIVVSSADAFGRLGKGSNYGKQNVDVLVPAEDIEVIDHRGARAEPVEPAPLRRVSALLAVILQETRLPASGPYCLSAQPGIPSAGQHSKYGWIPDPTDRFRLLGAKAFEMNSRASENAAGLYCSINASTRSASDLSLSTPATCTARRNLRFCGSMSR